MSQEAYKLYRLLKEIVECCQTRESFQADSQNLTISEARCLMAMVYEDCNSTGELKESLYVAKSRVTRIVDGLVSKGLVTRCEDQKDRRIIRIELTQKGRETAVSNSNIILALHKEVLSSLPQDSKDGTIQSLNILLDAMNVVKSKMESSDLELKINQTAKSEDCFFSKNC